jgi:hypothetical protein
MAALDDAARATKALLAPDEAVLFKQMIASNTSMEDIAKRIGLLRRANRKGKDMGGTTEDVVTAIKRLNELADYKVLNANILAKRAGRNRELGLTKQDVIKYAMPEGSPMLAGNRVEHYDRLAREAVARQESYKPETMSLSSNPETGLRFPNFTTLMRTLRELNPEAAKDISHFYGLRTNQAGSARAKSEMVRLLANLLGEQ